MNTKKTMFEPAEDAEYKVEHEERAEDHQSDKVDPRPLIALRVIDLRVKSPNLIKPKCYRKLRGFKVHLKANRRELNLTLTE